MGMLSRWKKSLLLIFSSMTISSICLCAGMLLSQWKGIAFIDKVNSRCFCWFPAAILVHQKGTPIWHHHTKLYKGAWNISTNNSETVGDKDLRLTQIDWDKLFITFHFLAFLHWTVSNLLFCCMKVKRMYKEFLRLTHRDLVRKLKSRKKNFVASVSKMTTAFLLSCTSSKYKDAASPCSIPET